MRCGSLCRVRPTPNPLPQAKIRMGEGKYIQANTTIWGEGKGSTGQNEDNFIGRRKLKSLNWIQFQDHNIV